MLYPIQRIDEKGILSNIFGTEVFFEFITTPQYHEIDIIKNSLQSKELFINSLTNEIQFQKIEEALANPKLQEKITILQKEIETAICAEVPNAFWEHKKHIVLLPYESDFKESQIPTKARPIAMSPEYIELCKKEIQDLFNKGLIRPSYSP